MLFSSNLVVFLVALWATFATASPAKLNNIADALSDAGDISHDLTNRAENAHNVSVEGAAQYLKDGTTKNRATGPGNTSPGSPVASRPDTARIKKW